MSGPAMLMHMLLERLHRHPLPRVPEPDLVMNDPQQVEAFAASGREDGVLAPIYAFHTLHAAAAIRPGDRVLDLACGPANQLAQFAQAHPDCDFIGVDVSANMLALGEQTLRRTRVRNVALRQDDACALTSFDDHSVDCVTCTMSLHHLPDVDALRQAMRAVKRVLKPGGGLYLADFGRLRRPATQHYFAHDRVALQTPLFTADFLHSLRAAFSVDELQGAMDLLADADHRAPRRHQTMLAPFMVVFRRTRPSAPGSQALARCRTLLHERLTDDQRLDLKALSLWFKASGLPPPIHLP